MPLLKRRAELIGISRVYYKAPHPRRWFGAHAAHRPTAPEEHPFIGARMLRDQLNRAGCAVGRKARASIMQYLDWYNRSRPHSKLKKKTPVKVYAVMLPTIEQAA
ncbi:MAG: integrase core domain-containing protein [Desulfobulbus sp.]|nr:integrase core domain-containing protein [Desulfobulbus sp.]